MSVSVLTTSHWPVQIVAGSPIALPPILQECTQTFEQYYDSRHSGRRLTWQGNQGTVDLRIRFKARTHEVSCSTQAACVLLCFEELGEGQSLGYYVSTLLFCSCRHQLALQPALMRYWGPGKSRANEIGPQIPHVPERRRPISNSSVTRMWQVSYPAQIAQGARYLTYR